MHLLQLQTKVFADKAQTLSYLEKFIDDVITAQTDFIALPEMFCCPYENKFFPLYAEKHGGAVYQFCGIWRRNTAFTFPPVLCRR